MINLLTFDIFGIQEHYINYIYIFLFYIKDDIIEVSRPSSPMVPGPGEATVEEDLLVDWQGHRKFPIISWPWARI